LAYKSILIIFFLLCRFEEGGWLGRIPWKGNFKILFSYFCKCSWCQHNLIFQLPCCRSFFFFEFGLQRKNHPSNLLTVSYFRCCCSFAHQKNIALIYTSNKQSPEIKRLGRWFKWNFWKYNNIHVIMVIIGQFYLLQKDICSKIKSKIFLWRQFVEL
jgi:hypothetical protein